MSGSKFVVQEGHFHIADKNSYVLTGWFEERPKQPQFSVFLDNERRNVQVRCLADDSVRQKYAKYDLKVSEEYVIIVKLPRNLAKYRRLSLCLADGSTVYERRISQLRRLQGKLNYRITGIQSAGAGCVIHGWAASEKPIKINVFDQAEELVRCEVSHFPKPDVALEFRESEALNNCGFSVTVPVNGRKKMILQITDGERSVKRAFRAVDKNRLLLYVKKANYYMKRNGWKKACKRAVNELYELAGDTANYSKWRTKNLPSHKELERQRRDSSTFRPLLSVITPYEESPHFIETARSVAEQTYDRWKWVLVCTPSEKQKLTRQLRTCVPCVPKERLQLILSDQAADTQQKIALAVHETIAGMQEHDWMTFLSSSDTLEPDACYRCVKMMEKEPDMDMCYTDEDRISDDGKVYSEPAFKSDFNIDLLRAVSYFGHLLLVRQDVAQKTGPWNAAYSSDAAYDYALRAAESASHIGHLPCAVYHAREKASQTSDAGIQILNAHYERIGLPAEAKATDIPGIYHTIYHWKKQPLVSINIPNKDHIDDLDTCVQSVLSKCTYPNYEIVIIENNSTQESTFAYYEKLQAQDRRVRVVYWKEAFNYSRITNFGVSQSDGEYILLLNNDTEVISPDFMEEMLGYCMREDVGICGARLFYFDNTIQHAGVIVGLGGICGEGFQGFEKENGGYLNRIFCPQNYSAVTAACLMTKKSVFEQVGGMDADLQIAYNDIDYCLKVRRSGKLVVYNPFAMLHHYEYKSRGTENTAEKLARYHREVDRFTSRWADMISAGDPYYNPNLTRRYQDFSLRRIELLK